MILRIIIAFATVAVAVAVFGRKNLGQTRALSANAVATMDWLRGLAALAVLIGHARGLFMQDFAQLNRPSVLWKAFYFGTALGHEAVIIFFILSGFLVGTTVLTRIAERRWDLKEYLSRRLTRLYVVLIPGLVLTWAWDGLGIGLFGTSGIYGGHIDARHLTLPNVNLTHSWDHFLGNLVFLQHLFIQPYGSNGPLWSLPYEFWSYLLFPLLVQAGRREVSTTRRLVLALTCVCLIACGGWKLGLYFSIWLLGAAVGLWWRASDFEAPRWAPLAFSVLVGGALVLSNVSKWHRTILDVALALVTAGLLACVLARPVTRAAGGRVSGQMAAVLASFSYTLYVVHYPVLTFLFAASMGGTRRAASASTVAAILALSLALVVYAFLVSRLTETHTERVRAWLASKV